MVLSDIYTQYCYRANLTLDIKIKLHYDLMDIHSNRFLYYHIDIVKEFELGECCQCRNTGYYLYFFSSADKNVRPSATLRGKRDFLGP